MLAFAQLLAVVGLLVPPTVLTAISLSNELCSEEADTHAKSLSTVQRRMRSVPCSDTIPLVPTSPWTGDGRVGNDESLFADFCATPRATLHLIGAGVRMLC